jgi:hypothetical protein
MGVVSHTVVIEDEDIPGMGIRFRFDQDSKRADLRAAVDELEESFLNASLPDEVLA